MWGLDITVESGGQKMKLEVKNIRKSFGDKEVLHGIDFQVESGKALGLLGRNGAGKTTTIRILMDVFHANSGEILLEGKKFVPGKHSIGYLPEERGLYPKRTVIDQMIYLACLRGMNPKEAKESAKKWLARLEVSEYETKKLETLSKGNQQKIQLITALAHNPQIVILDEPFSGLDPVNAMLLKDVVKEEIARGKIVLFSSHQMNYIEEFCDSIAILNQGKVVLSGDLHDIKRNYTRDKLVVRSEQAGRIAAALGAQCKSIRQDELLIQLSSSDEKQNMMQMLTQKYNIDEIRVFEPSLNDIFVEYAGDQEAGGAK